MPTYDGPPPLTGARWVTAWTPQVSVIVVLVVVAGLYLYGAAVLRRRGDGWSPWRTASFLVGGLGLVAVATMSVFGTYDDTLFWVHMAQHMLLSMVAPIFLALGAPVTLALRTLPLGGRRGLTKLLHSRVAAVFVNPVVGAALLFGTPFVLYTTGLYGFTLDHDWAHQLIHVHFLVVGCLFFWPILGTDPVPGRLPYVMRLLLVFVSLPAHAWLGISIMSQTSIIGGEQYRALGRTWGPSLAHDQAIGGGLLWSTGDLVGLLVVAALFVQWSRADGREAVRVDRRLDRADRAAAVRAAADRQREADAAEEARLAAYNARLAALAEQD